MDESRLMSWMIIKGDHVAVQKFFMDDAMDDAMDDYPR